jgi:uncharacterized protein (DUF3084 family)
MDLSDPKTWTDGLWVIASAPHIVVPLLFGVGTAVWLVRGKLEQSKRDGLQATINGRDKTINGLETEIKGREAIINGRDAQITGLNAQMSVLRERLDLAKEQSYVAGKLDDAQAEIAKLKQQIEDRAALELLRATVNSTMLIIDEALSANARLGNTISNPSVVSAPHHGLTPPSE